MSAKKTDRIRSCGFLRGLLARLLFRFGLFLERQEHRFCGIDDIYRNYWNEDR